jgi:hypothetical protein
MTGTTDVVIVEKSYIDVYDLRGGIQAGFELKKAVQDIHTYEAIGKLLVANARS